MGKEWTDVDYAQAAIDMLPGTVEEIDAWMKVHGIKNLPPGNGARSCVCPIAQWIRRWTGTESTAGYEYAAAVLGQVIALPKPVQQYILWADSLSHRG